MTATATVRPDGSVTVIDGITTYPPLSPDAVQAIAAQAQASKNAASVAVLEEGLVTLAGLLAEAGSGAAAHVDVTATGASATVDQTSMGLVMQRFPGQWDGHGHWVSGGMTFTPAQRSVTDGTTEVGATVTSATANFQAWDANRVISGGTIPTGTTIAAVVDTQTVTLSAPATAAATGVTLTIG